MTDIKDLLLAVKAEADNGHEGCQRLLNYKWKSPEDCIKGLLVLNTACRIDEKIPRLFSTSADEIIGLTESGKWDDALWQLYPTAMKEIYCSQ